VGELDRFSGIIITMYANDHPPPHIHVRYNEYSAKIAINDGTVIVGKLPRRVLRLVEHWRLTHRLGLFERWAIAELGQNPPPIKESR